VEINIFIHGAGAPHWVEKLQASINAVLHQGTSTMSKVDELSAKVDSLVTAVGTAATDITAALTDLQAEVVALQGSSVTDAQLQAISDKIDPILTQVGSLDAAAKAADPGTPPAP